MDHKDIFHFLWIDIKPAGNNHPFFSSGEEYIMILIHITKVAGVEPAVAEYLCSCLRVFIIALHYIFPADDYFSYRSIGHFLIVFIEYFHYNPGKRRTDRTKFLKFFFTT